VELAVAAGLLLVLGAAIGVAFRFAAGQARAQADLATSYSDADAERERLSVVLRSVPEGLLVLDAEGRVLTANAQAAALWGLTVGEIGGLSLDTLAARDALRRDGEPWHVEDLLQEGGSGGGPEEVTTAASRRVLETGATAVVGASGERIGTIVLLRDVTERKQVEQLREELTHMMVHDLRTPLTGIETSLQAIQPAVQEDELHSQLVGVGLQSSKRLLRMIEAMVDIGRLEAGQMPLKESTIDVGELISGVAGELQSHAAAKDIEIEVRVEPGVTARADRDVVERVVFNLVGNALKFVPRAAEVEVSCRDNGEGAVVVAVRDTGPGISKENQTRVFDRFTEAGQRQQWGSGLGLAFCKLAVDAQGGEIWVESELGEGSTFLFTVPSGKVTG